MGGGEKYRDILRKGKEEGGKDRIESGGMEKWKSKV
jgi:hypothetical protein